MLILNLGANPILDVYSAEAEHLVSVAFTPNDDCSNATAVLVSSFDGVREINAAEPFVVPNGEPFKLAGEGFELTFTLEIRQSGKMVAKFETPTNAMVYRRTASLASKLETVRVGLQAIEAL
jgi:hypothetical protein